MEVDDAARREIIRQILELEGNREQMTEEHIKANQSVLYCNACVQFGAWRIALEYAGVRLKRRTNRKPPPTPIISGIRRRCASLNSVRAKYVRITDNRLYRAAIDAFGSWNAAVDAAGIQRSHLYFGPSHPKPTSEEILDLLRARAEAGESMRMSDFSYENQAVARAIMKHFGCWKKALIASGIRAPDRTADISESSQKQP
jgi:Homing endonuclease associated repeat